METSDACKFVLAFVYRGVGFHCLLCKKHQTGNIQNKELKFTEEPCISIKERSLRRHFECSAHQRAELLNRESYFQQKLDHDAETEDDVYFRVFYAIYWLVKHHIANK